MLAERAALVEQHDRVPLRPLRLVDGERVAVVELVGVASRRVGQVGFDPSKNCRSTATLTAARPGSSSDLTVMRTKSLRSPENVSTRQRPPLIRPLMRSLRRQTSLSPATGSGSGGPLQLPDALIVEAAV